MNKLTKVKLSDVADIIGGGTPDTKKQEFWNGNIPWITPKDLSSYNYRYISNGERNITKKGLENSSARILPQGSILLTSRAPIGYIAIAQNELCTNQGFKSLILKENNCPLFFYYLLKNNIKYIINMSSGSTFPEISGSQVKNLEFNIPDLTTQEKIARVLSSLDDKIELNNKINQNLEQQAQAIFKSWFVDFEPFGGKMPADWSLKTLSDVSNITAGGDKPDIVSNIETEECKIPIYSNGIDKNGLYGYTTEPKISQESVTVSARGTIGFTCLRLHPYVPIVRLISLIPDTNIVSAKYLYFTLLNKHITGTGTTQQQLTVPYFKTTSIIVPTFDVVNQFTEIVNSFYKIIEKNICENKKLTQLRDTLLPKLMSGEIDVDKVEV